MPTAIEVIKIARVGLNGGHIILRSREGRIELRFAAGGDKHEGPRFDEGHRCGETNAAAGTRHQGHLVLKYFWHEVSLKIEMRRQRPGR